MRMFRSFLLGFAGVLSAMSMASAANLSVMANPVHYAKNNYSIAVIGIDNLAQKLQSSETYRGSPARGFNHVVIGKRPKFATKMIA